MTNPPGAMPPLPARECGPHTGHVATWTPQQMHDYAQAYAAPLIARVAELEADAARYRWLRAQHWNENTLAVVLRPKDNTKLGCFLPFDDLLDQAIDTARAALTPTKD